MDSALHYKVYGKGINQQVILKYTEYVKICYFPNLTKDNI